VTSSIRAIDLGVPEDSSEGGAERIRHLLSDEPNSKHAGVL
jgi:hypothetical protein